MSARETTDWVTLYWRQIEAGEVVVCQKTRAIYQRLSSEIAKDEGRWTFDPERANRPISFIERFCRHSKGAWAGKLVVLELWQKAFIAALFGFIDRDTGERRFLEAILCIGRKGGKSFLASCILVYLFFCEGQADIVCAATKMDQARKVYDECVKIIQKEPALERRVTVRKNPACLYIESAESSFRPLGRNSHTMDGENCSAVCIDELHALEGPNGRNLVEVLRQSQSARPQSARTSTLLLMVTTAGTVRGGIFDETYQLASNILDGTISGPAADRFLPVIYELDSPDEWHQIPDEDGYLEDGTKSAWFKANPSLQPQGNVKQIKWLISMCQKAEQNPPDVPGILCKDFNIRSSAQGAWLQLHEIENDATFDLRDYAGHWCIGSCDLSLVGDLTCASIVIKGEGDTWLCHQCYFIPSDNLQERIEHDRIPYDRWIEQGLVRTCEGGVIRTEDVTQWFLEIVRKYDISVHSVWYDSWSATAWVAEMKKLGFRMVPVHQGAKTLSIPLDHLENALRKKQIIFNEASTGPNTTLLWSITNCGVVTDRNQNRLLCKCLSPRHRIDGAASLLDAWVGVVNNPDFQYL